MGKGQVSAKQAEKKKKTQFCDMTGACHACTKACENRYDGRRQNSWPPDCKILFLRCSVQTLSNFKKSMAVPNYQILQININHCNCRCYKPKLQRSTIQGTQTEEAVPTDQSRQMSQNFEQKQNLVAQKYHLKMKLYDDDIYNDFGQ